MKIKKIIKILPGILVIMLMIFFLYFNNLARVNPQTVSFYKELKDSLRKQGYSARLLVISTKRFKWHNDLQVKFSGAAKGSRHLVGDAIDFIVFDINKDGNADHKDVDIVFELLDSRIVRNRGGVGTYKKEKSFFSRQMIHIDARGYRARWAR